jgi:DNA sulfur modification protein DndC
MLWVVLRRGDEVKISELVTATKAVIMKMYLDENDKRDWAIAYSGGKDSTAVMGLVVSVIEALPEEKRARAIHGVMSDTIVENPLVKEHMAKQARLINEYCKSKGLPISVKQVHRELNDSYFVKVLGLGYPLPLNNGRGRWCTDRLKIKPQDQYLKEINPSYILTGVRKAESSSRANSIEKWSISEFIGNHVSLKDRNTFNPIVNWTIQDVWKYLELEGLSWGSTLSVRQIYKDATGECGFTNPEEVGKKSVEVCGARHGCWLCPVVLKDRSTEKMSEKHEWLEPLTEWRMMQLKVYGSLNHSRKAFKERNEAIKKWSKAGYNRKGQKMEEGQGTLTVQARKYLLGNLLETESIVNRMRKLYKLEPIELISNEEIEQIKAHWENDEKERGYLVGQPLTKEVEILLEN